MVRQANLRREPELCLAIRVRNVDMNASFFAGEEKESELSVSYNCGCHRATVLQRAMPVIADSTQAGLWHAVQVHVLRQPLQKLFVFNRIRHSRLVL